MAGCNRREFLRKTLTLGSAMAFPAIVPAVARGANGLTAPGNKIVMGAVGIGMQGTGNLQNFLGMPDVRVVAVCDVDAGHLEEARKLVNKKYGNEDCKGYAAFEEMFARGDLDAACLAVPDHWHAPIAIAAARAGIDAYGEKPLAHSLREGRAICDAVERYGRVWQTGSWQRSSDNFRRACELVRNGRIGKVLKVEVGLPMGYNDFSGLRAQMEPRIPPAGLDYERWLGPAPWAPYAPARVHMDWRWVYATGGGQLMDWVGHHVDIAHWGLGLDRTGPVEVEGTGSIEGFGSWDTHTEFSLACRYADGLAMQVGTEFDSGVWWHGDAGRIHVSREKLEIFPVALMKEIIEPGEIRLYESRNHWRNFIDCVRSRRETAAPAEIGHRSASVGHLGVIALKTGRRLRWDPAGEEIIGDDDAARLLGNAYREPWQPG